MTGAVSGSLFIMLLLHWCSPPVVMVEGLGNASRSIMEMLSFGKVWYVYIKANIFDIVVHTFRIKTEQSNTMLITLHSVLKQMEKFKILRYPCQSLHISFDRSAFHDITQGEGFPQTALEILTRSKVCGSISRSYGIIAPSTIVEERNDTDLTWRWQMQVNQHFIINVTFLSLQTPFYPSCLTTRAIIEELYGTKNDLAHKRTLGVFCPNNPPQSFYSKGNHISINIHTWPVYVDFFLQNVYFNQWIGTVSFTYEILDNDLSFDAWIPARLPTGRHDYDHWHLHLIDRSVWGLPELFTVHLSEESRNAHHASYFYNTPYLFEIFETKGEIVYIFHFQSPLGETMVVKEGSLTCTKNQVTLVAFEGPMVAIAMVESLLARLQEWKCGHTLNATNHKAELKGRIGDMIILFLVEKTNELYFYSLTLNVVFRAIEANPTFALVQTLPLDPSGSSVDFKQRGTFFYSISISVKNGFINVMFDHLSLRGHMGQSCTYGGLHIKNYYTSFTRYVGGMCSHKAATHFQRLYGRHGLTLNDRVVIYIKQYNLLFLARVKLRFSLDRCFGLVNLQMHSAPYGEYYIDETEQLEVTKVKQFYGYGSNFYYRWYGVESFLGIKRSIGTVCFKLHYVNFDSMPAVAFITSSTVNKVVVGIGHAENIRPSRMSLAFWNTDVELKQFDSCLANAFRFFPDNENNEPYVLLRMPENDSWATLAFAAKFALDKTCLVLGGAFHIQVHEADSYPECFSEVGGYLYDGGHPIILQGVCGGSLVNFFHWHGFIYNQISFQRPLLHARCCI